MPEPIVVEAPVADAARGAEPQKDAAQPSPGEKTPAENKEQPNAPTEEPRVPLSRFQKIYDRNKELEAQVNRQPQPTSAPAELTEEQAADQQVRQYIDQVLSERETAKSKEVAQEAKVLEDKLDFYKEVDPQVNQDVLKDIVGKYHLNYSVDENGRELHPIDIAYSLWKGMSTKEQAIAKDAAKSAAAKPASPVSTKTGGTETDTPGGTKSIMQMAQEAKKQLGT